MGEKVRFVILMSLDTGGTPGPAGFAHIHEDGSENSCQETLESAVIICTTCGFKGKKQECEEYYPKFYK